MEKPPSLPSLPLKPIDDGLKAVTDAPQGKLSNLWTRCFAQPSKMLGSSILRTLTNWGQIGGKENVATNAIKRINFVSRFLKKLPEVSLNCQVSASFSINSSKKNAENERTEEDSEKEERRRRIARIEHEIRTLERHMRNYKTKY